MEANELVIVIPAYEPDRKLIELIDKLNNYFSGHHIVVVDDGSQDKKIFSSVVHKANVELLTHEVNRGKGAALKTAFMTILDCYEESIIVTADSDGQHKPEDIFRVYNFYKKYNEGIVLGSRKFEGEIPKRSAFGNNCARALLQMTAGYRLNDTQTGLRAFHSSLLEFMLEIEKDRYDYEMTMLTLAIQRNIPIHEIAIETIYIDNNASSHFRPVQDFLKICAVILKYTLPLFFSMMIYFTAFSIIYLQLITYDGLKNIAAFLASISACAFTVILNLIINTMGISYGNRYIVAGVKRGLFYLSGTLVIVLALSGITHLFSLILPIAAAVILGVLITFILLVLQFYFMAVRSKLYED